MPQNEEWDDSLPWYQKLKPAWGWFTGSIGTVAIFFANWDTITHFVTWQVTVIGSALIILLVFAAWLILKYLPRKDDKPRRLRPEILFGSLGILLALWMPPVGNIMFGETPRMTANIKIAVAEFVVTEAHLAPAAKAISQANYAAIRKNIDQIKQEFSNVSMDVWPPDQTPAITNAADAEAVAGKINADIVIYGVVSPGSQPETVVFEPRMYVAKDSVFGLPEFIGEEVWGSPVEWLTGEGTEAQFKRDQLTQNLFLPRAKGLVYAIYGVWKYQTGDYDASVGLFHKAVESASQDDGEALSVWQLWLGNAEGKLHHFDAASQAYKDALTARPGYARAYIGQGEAAIAQANLNGVVNIQDFLNYANARLGLALASAHPVSADIEAKADFNFGRIAQTKYKHFLVDRSANFSEAWNRYQDVVTAFKTNPRIQEQAGLAYMHLGELAIETGDYQTAKTQFEQAIANLHDPTAQEVTLSDMAELPVLDPGHARYRLMTAIAITTGEPTREYFQKRIDCLGKLATPAPPGSLVCINNIK